MKLILATLFVFAVPTAALSADATPTEPTTTYFDWSGVYVGIQGGSVFSTDGRVPFDSQPASDFYDIDMEGGFGGFQAGYNHQFTNNVVIGVETDVAFGDLNYSSVWLTPTGPDTTYLGQGDLDWLGSTRARLGYAMDRWLPFATVGVAYAGIDFVESHFGVVHGRGDATLVGWTAGAGVNYALTEHLIIGAEYHYSDFGSTGFTEYGEGVFSGVTASGAFDLDIQDVRFSLSYKF